MGYARGAKYRLGTHNMLDVYGKYFWTHQSGDSVTLSTNDPVRFESIDSHRLRLGGRSNYVVNRRLGLCVNNLPDLFFHGVVPFSMKVMRF